MANERTDRFKHLLRMLLRPPGWVICACVPTIVLLMVWAFLFGGEYHPLSVCAYVLSAYCLVVICVWLITGQVAKKAKEAIRKNAFAAHMLDDEDYRRLIFLLGGVIINGVYAVGNLLLGLFPPSVWFITLGCYYLLLTLMRALVLGYVNKNISLSKACRVERLCGWLFIVSTFVLSGIVTLVMTGEGKIVYDPITVIAIAAFTFYALISALVGFIRLRKHDNPLVVVNCRINLAIALVSMFSLEIAMFSAFATVDDADLTFVLPIITGAFIAAFLIVLGVRSLQQARAGAKSAL